MQTTLTAEALKTPQGKEADAILRRCVHCGFCTATCPTYQLLGDELDGPRGRIYLVKQLLEGNEVTRETQLHLDRCLTCRSCETTCPSGVNYHRLADIGRELLEHRVARPWHERAARFALRKLIPYQRRMHWLMGMGRLARPILPEKLARKIPPKQSPGVWPTRVHARKMLVLDACGQSSGSPNTNAATARVLDKLGVQLYIAPRAGCCGAVSHHLAQPDEALNFVRNNIDAWWPHIDAGAEAIVITASGCGAMVKDYGELLRNDPRYADKAKRVAALAKDISEILRDVDLTEYAHAHGKKVAFHAPCTLQHGQRITGAVEKILRELGYDLAPVPDAHLCCGSAGTYSLLQPALSKQLLENKLTALQSEHPDLIATANIGCHLHLASASRVPVYHWIECVDQVLR